MLSGVGRYQMLGEPVQILLPGDTVVIPPNSEALARLRPTT